MAGDLVFMDIFHVLILLAVGRQALDRVKCWTRLHK